MPPARGEAALTSPPSLFPNTISRWTCLIQAPGHSNWLANNSEFIIGYSARSEEDVLAEHLCFFNQATRFFLFIASLMCFAKL